MSRLPLILSCKTRGDPGRNRGYAPKKARQNYREASNGFWKNIDLCESIFELGEDMGQGVRVRRVLW